jgi:hypothetical protein
MGTDLVPGTPELLILRTLERGEAHGYTIIGSTDAPRP